MHIASEGKEFHQFLFIYLLSDLSKNQWVDLISHTGEIAQTAMVDIEQYSGDHDIADLIIIIIICYCETSRG